MSSNTKGVSVEEDNEYMYRVNKPLYDERRRKSDKTDSGILFDSFTLTDSEDDFTDKSLINA